MKKILVWLMERELENSKKDLKKEVHSIVKHAKEHRVKSYETTLLFLKS